MAASSTSRGMRENKSGRDMQRSPKEAIFELFEESLRSQCCALLVAVLLTGCAFGRDRISLSYVPQTTAARISKADAIAVNVYVTDHRPRKDRVSSKKNYYRMETARIIATNDVADLLKNAIETELTNRGFSLAGNSVNVLVDLQNFYCDFSFGLTFFEAIAEVTMKVQVEASNKRLIFSKTVEGSCIDAKAGSSSGKYAKAALDSALRDGMSILFNDPTFIDSLFKASQQ